MRKIVMYMSVCLLLITFASVGFAKSDISTNAVEATNSFGQNIKVENLVSLNKINSGIRNLEANCLLVGGACTTAVNGATTVVNSANTICGKDASSEACTTAQTNASTALSNALLVCILEDLQSPYMPNRKNTTVPANVG